MVPVVVLIERPNVGKPTLFNRLTRIRDTLVADLPGLAHDRKYDRAKIEDRELICIDTGGIDGIEDSVETRMAEQSLLAIEEVDVVLFMVDTCADLMPAGEAIAKHLHSRQRPTFLVANRTDGLDPDQAVVDFYSLGLDEIHPVAISHGCGVLNLLEHALLSWTDDVAPQEGVDKDVGCQVQSGVKKSGGKEPEDDSNPQDLSVKLAIVGRSNIGKPTLTNRILGEDRAMVYDTPGTTRDSIYILMQRDEREYVFTDTAGVRKCDKITEVVEKFSVIKTLQAIEDVNVVMLVIGAREGISDQDLSLLGFTLSSGRPLAIVVSKWDGLTQEIKEQVEETLDFHLGFIDFARVHFVSALHDSNVGNLFEPVRKTHDSSTCRMSIATLTHVTTMTVEDRQPLLVYGRRVKPKYTRVGGYNLPIVVIHSSQVRDLSDSYERCLMNYFRKSLDMMGAPIRIQFKEGGNLFANKHSILMPTQMCKCKRLIKHIRKSK